MAIPLRARLLLPPNDFHVFWAAIFALLTAALPTYAQTGHARSAAPCSVANTGNDNRIVITNCAGLPESTRKQITEILNNQAKDRAENEQKFQQLLDRFNQLLDRFNQVSPYFQPDNKEETLRKLFPSGYVIFDVDHTNAVFPYPSHDLEDFRIDWSKAAVLEHSPSTVTLRLPDLYEMKHQNSVLGSDVSWTPPVLESVFWVGKMESSSFDCLVEGGELLSVQNSGVVFVIGFKKIPCHS